MTIGGILDPHQFDMQHFNTILKKLNHRIAGNCVNKLIQKYNHFLNIVNWSYVHVQLYTDWKTYTLRNGKDTRRWDPEVREFIAWICNVEAESLYRIFNSMSIV